MKVSIEKKYLDAVVANSELLEYLIAHGVEDWDGYADALEEYNDDKED